MTLITNTNADRAALQRAVAANIQQVGDVLLAFGATSLPAQGRMGSRTWTVHASMADWRLVGQPASDQWCGYPILHLADRDHSLWLLGELYGESDPQETAVQVAQKLRSPESLNGHFLLLEWEPLQRQWHVWTDRFGTLHAYHAHSGNRGALGTFFPAVAQSASQRRLDHSALTGFFACGYFPADRTHFDDVRMLQPASHYVFDEHGRVVNHERYFRWSYEPAHRRSYDDTVEQFAGIFQAVMQDMFRGGRIAVPISGGLDSRTTVAAATPDPGLTERLWAYAYGYGERSVETRIAAEVARCRNLEFEAFSIEPYLFDELPRVLDCVEGFQDVTQCRQASVIDHIAARAERVVAAHLGDVWLDDAGLSDAADLGMSDEQLAHVAWSKIKKRGSDWLLAHVSGVGSVDDQMAALQDSIRCHFAAYDDAIHPDLRLKAFKTDQWSHRWTTASLRMFQAAAFPRLPFYDNRLAEFFCTVPVEFHRGRRLQIDYLKRFAPDLARVRWQPYGSDLFHYDRNGVCRLLKRATKKAWRVATRQRVIERNWEVQFLSTRGRAGLRRWLTARGLRLHEFFWCAAIEQLLGTLDAKPLDPRTGYALSMLLTFSAWLERHG